MHIAVMDGKVVFATHVFTLIGEFDRRDLLGLTRKGVEVVCYSAADEARAREVLESKGIPHTVAVLEWDQSKKDKAKDLKYNSRSEAIQHLNDEIEMPDSELVPHLRKKVKESEVNRGQLQQRVTDLEARVAALEAK